MPRETVAEREERERLQVEKLDAERKANNARASKAGVDRLAEDPSEEDLEKTDKSLKEAATREPPEVFIPPDATFSQGDPASDVYETVKDGPELKEKGVTPRTKEALETVVIKSNTVAVNPLPRPENEVKDEATGKPKYQPRDVIAQAGITVMTLDKSTYRAPGGVEEWLPIGTIIKNFKGVLSKVHAVITDETVGTEPQKKT